MGRLAIRQRTIANLPTAEGANVERPVAMPFESHSVESHSVESHSVVMRTVMRSVVGLVFVTACAVATVGCARGFIYNHTTVPLVTDFKKTPAGERSERNDVKSFRYYVRVDWDENAIGAVAKEHGLEEIYYADIETLSVLRIWTQRWVHVVGR